MPNPTHKYSRLALLALAAGAAGGCVPPLERHALPPAHAPAQAAAQVSSASSAPALGARSLVTSIPSNLDDFIARPELAFAWKQESQSGNTTLLDVTSQEWQGSKWTHKVEIVRPAQEAAPGAALIFINFGNPNPQQTFVAQLASNATGLTIVNAFNVPNQPLWNRYEDDLIAYTFSKYLEEKDPNSDWPLLLPMTKSATQIMRAVEEWSRPPAGDRPAHPVITKWGVTGASKRGWTTWLVAAAEEKAHPGKVLGIIPMVYDNLNLARQMPHQKESWGAYSEMIADYTKHGLPDMASTPRGQELAAIVDPWTYRARLKRPKLLINASNDPYWTLDSFNLYRNDLSGPTNVFYAPNSGHILNGNEARVAGITAAWFKIIAAGKTPPQVLAHIVDASNQPTDAASGEVLAARTGLKWRLQVLAPDGALVAPRNVKVWAASSATRDFRHSRWQSIDLKPSDGAKNNFEIALDDARLKGEDGAPFHALYGEVGLPGGIGDDVPEGSLLAIRVPFALSSPVAIWK